jgi:hypothetical protein
VGSGVAKSIVDLETTNSTPERYAGFDERAREDSRGDGVYQTVWMGRVIARERPEAARSTRGHSPFHHGSSDRAKELYVPMI